MRILGIDPGLQRTGFGVVDIDGARLSYVASGTISTLEVARGNLPARLKVIYEGVAEVKQRYAPQAASVEIVFVNVNPQSTLLLGQARGAALGTALFWITPFKLGQALAMAAIAAAAGTLGDLVMSALKRDAGVRYWGNTSSVTGAVGLLDRVAPLCFAAPVFFHSVRWYFQLRP